MSLSTFGTPPHASLTSFNHKGLCCKKVVSRKLSSSRRCEQVGFHNRGFQEWGAHVGIGLKKKKVSPLAASDWRSVDSSCLGPDISKNVLAIILGGGAGTRLYPITKNRAKPAVPLGANYRLIDIPVSNCINSDVLRVYVLTQYNSTSLNRHISLSYPSNIGSYKNEGFVEVLAAQQSQENPSWFKGTADAVRKYLWLFGEHSVREYLILAGDHLYRMNYQKFVQTHRQTLADITIAALPVDEKQASSLGLIKINSEGRIIEFVEKPEGENLKKLKVDTSGLGIDKEEAKKRPYVASMGIYVMSKDILPKLLCDMFPDSNDFGREVIPRAISAGMKVQAHIFDGYWEDIGTITSFYNANLGLIRPLPAFSLYDRSFPIYTQKRSLPPSKILASAISDSLVGEGCILKRCQIHRSVIGICSYIEDGATIEDSLMLGADYYESDVEKTAIIANGGTPLGIGKNTHIRKAIVDKNVRIGDNVKIINADNVQEASRENDGYCIRSGIVIIIKGAVIPNGTII